MPGRAGDPPPLIRIQHPRSAPPFGGSGIGQSRGLGRIDELGKQCVGYRKALKKEQCPQTHKAQRRIAVSGFRPPVLLDEQFRSSSMPNRAAAASTPAGGIGLKAAAARSSELPDSEAGVTARPGTSLIIKIRFRQATRRDEVHRAHPA